MDLYGKVLDITSVKDDTQASQLLRLNRAAIVSAQLSGWRGWIFTHIFKRRCRAYLKKYGSN